MKKIYKYIVFSQNFNNIINYLGNLDLFQNKLFPFWFLHCINCNWVFSSIFIYEFH